jgi:hypothetical protein
VLQVDVGDARKHPFHFKRKNIDRIYVDAREGNDAVSVDEDERRLHGHDRQRRSTAGTGTTPWPAARDRRLLLGSGGDDSIDGNGGPDTALMGAGDDTFIWDPGDGSDIVEGQDGNDRMVFNGAAAAEQVDVSANGSRLRFFRNPGNITMDTASVETSTSTPRRHRHDHRERPHRHRRGQLNLDLAAALGGWSGMGRPTASPSTAPPTTTSSP